MFVAWLASLGAPVMAQEAGITARLHPWAKFNPGVWKLVRVATETRDDQGRWTNASTADTRTTLVDVDNDAATLEIETCMEVAGKRFQAEPQILRQRFCGELAVPNVSSKEPVDGQVVIEERTIPCKMQSWEIVSANERTNLRLYYSPTVWPYVLKREYTMTDPEGKHVLSQTTVEVIALDLPIRVQGETHNGAYVKTVTKNAKGIMTTLAMVLPGIPGGVVRHSMKEVDKSGRVVRRGTLELLDYNANPEDRPFNRKRSSRRSKSAPR